jgi:hypothetical protein
MALKNYTTTVPVKKTVSEVQELLAKAGAEQISVKYDKSKLPVAITFDLELKGRVFNYAMPNNWEKVFTLLKQQNVVKTNTKAEQEKAENKARMVSWRITKNWLEAQLAIIEAEMATSLQVFLPYAKMANGGTVYENFELNASDFLSGENNNQILLD